jgi:hypothetical protein
MPRWAGLVLQEALLALLAEQSAEPYVEDIRRG